jgi:spore germination protein GerM
MTRRSTRPRRLGTALSVLAALVVASCSIGTENSPRDVPSADRVELRASAEPPTGAATGTARIYLESPEAPGQIRTLQPVARDVPETAASVLRALFDGPNAAELSQRLRTSLPEGLALLGTRLDGEVLVVDVSDQLRQLSGDVLVTAVAQIVLTATELRNVTSVQISVDGTPQQWPAGNAELQSDPLTRYDYPGIVLSTQPDYPAIPSPVQP